MRAMIRLEPMTPAEYKVYIGYAVKQYADGRVKAGDDAEGILERAQAEYDQLLPQGLETPNHHLLSIHADGVDAPVGLIWFEARDKDGRKSAYIFDFEVREELRGKGYGAATLRALEERVRAMGITRVSLNVWGFNTGAKALYERCGFTVTGIGMTKVLGTPSGA